MRILVAAVAIGLIVCFVGTVAAKPLTDEMTTASEHYKRGRKLYDLGKYDEAISEFQQAYEIRDEPVLLYNIAQSFRLSNKHERALHFYKTYLRRSPQAPNRADVEMKIAEMEKLVTQQQRVKDLPPPEVIAPPTRVEPRDEPAAQIQIPPQPIAPPQPIQPPPNPPSETASEPDPSSDTGRPGRSKIIAGAVIGAVGLAAAGAGITLGLIAADAARAQEGSRTFDTGLVANDHAMYGFILDGIGAAAVITGVVLIGVGIAQGRAPVAKSAAFVPTIGRHTAGAAFNIRF